MNVRGIRHNDPKSEMKKDNSYIRWLFHHPFLHLSFFTSTSRTFFFRDGWDVKTPRNSESEGDAQELPISRHLEGTRNEEEPEKRRFFLDSRNHSFEVKQPLVFRGKIKFPEKLRTIVTPMGKNCLFAKKAKNRCLTTLIFSDKLAVSGRWRKPMKPYPTLSNHHEGDNHFRCYQIIHQNSRIPFFPLEHFKNCCCSSDLGNTMKNQTQSSNDHVTLFHFEATGHPNLNLHSLLVGTSLKV